VPDSSASGVPGPSGGPEAGSNIDLPRSQPCCIADTVALASSGGRVSPYLPGSGGYAGGAFLSCGTRLAWRTRRGSTG